MSQRRRPARLTTGTRGRAGQRREPVAADHRSGGLAVLLSCVRGGETETEWFTYLMSARFMAWRQCVGVGARGRAAPMREAARNAALVFWRWPSPEVSGCSGAPGHCLLGCRPTPTWRDCPYGRCSGTAGQARLLHSAAAIPVPLEHRSGSPWLTTSPPCPPTPAGDADPLSCTAMGVMGPAGLRRRPGFWRCSLSNPSSPGVVEPLLQGIGVLPPLQQGRFRRRPPGTPLRVICPVWFASPLNRIEVPGATPVNALNKCT